MRYAGAQRGKPRLRQQRSQAILLYARARDRIEQAQCGGDEERQQRRGETECDQRTGIQQSVRVAHRADGKHGHEQSNQIPQNESSVGSSVILPIAG